jgi:transposase
MALYVKALRAEDNSRIEEMLKDEDPELARRAHIIQLSSQHVGVHEISRQVGLHPINVRKWIHRYNKYGTNGLFPRRSPGRPRLFSDEQRRAIVGLATTDPQDLGLEFDVWSLQRLRLHLIDQGLAPEISAETIRQELLRSGLVFEERHWVAQPTAGV